MSDLTGRTQNDTYKDLLHFENSNLGLDGTLRQIESGNGVGSALSLATVGAAIAGTLSVSGLTSFTVTPEVGGDVVWHAGNDGAGSGLDADTLQGNLPGAFIKVTDSPTLSGSWTFQGFNLHTRANNSEIMRFNDLTNNIQMRALFDTNLDFSLVPGTAGVFAPADSFFYDSSLNRWSTGTDFAITKLNGKLYINTAGGQVPVLSVESTLGNGALLGDAAFNTFMTSDDGLFHLLGNTTTQFNNAIIMQDGATVHGRVGYVADLDVADYLYFESLSPAGAGMFFRTDGFEIYFENTVGDLGFDVVGTFFGFAALDIDLGCDENMFLSGGLAVEIESTTGEVQINNVNGLAFISNDFTLLTATSSLMIRDGAGILQDAGFNGMPSQNFAANTNLLSANVGYKFNYTGAVVSALSISGDANIPQGSTWFGANLGTISFTVATTGITLNWLDGSGAAAPTGTRTIAVSGVFTLTKRAAGVYDIWGVGIS